MVAAKRGVQKEIVLPLKLYNTMARSKEIFKPLEDGKVKMFTCGPSIYQRPHLGNFRTFLFEDILLRYLEYGGYQVDRVINFTDVEDKAIAEAAKEGKKLDEITGRAADKFFDDSNLLRMKLPGFIPRSSTTVEEAVELIKILIEKGYAYWDKGDVFFEPIKFSGFGKLFRLDMSKWPKKPRRFRKDTYPGVQWNLGDFILWHGYKGGDGIYWDTDIGKGRPAWNIQDPAIISKHLGMKIDIACGGYDNIYRHHDYTIAVMESISGEEFCHYWIHGEHLLISGKKMSKSKGNIVYIDDLLEEGAKPEHIRFYLIYGRHMEKMDLTMERFREVSGLLDGFKELVNELIQPDQAVSNSNPEARNLAAGLTTDFEKAMNDDLDVRNAFNRLFETGSRLRSLKSDDKLGAAEAGSIEQQLRKIDEVLQVIFP